MTAQSSWRNARVQISTYKRPGGNQTQVSRAEEIHSPCSGPDVGNVLEDSCACRTAIRGVSRPLELYVCHTLGSAEVTVLDDTNFNPPRIHDRPNGYRSRCVLAVAQHIDDK